MFVLIDEILVCRKHDCVYKTCSKVGGVLPLVLSAVICSIRIERAWYTSSLIVDQCDLKVGSFSFKYIIILLIYFINCKKALLTRKWVSFSKKIQS